MIKMGSRVIFQAEKVTPACGQVEYITPFGNCIVRKSGSSDCYWFNLEDLTDSADINDSYIEKHFTAEMPKKGESNMNKLPEIEKVYFNNPVTVVMWSDHTKTIVRVSKDDIYDPEKGLAMAIAKKVLGNTYNYYNEFKRWLPKQVVKPRKVSRKT